MVSALSSWTGSAGCAHRKNHVDTHEHILYVDFMCFPSKGEEIHLTDSNPSPQLDTSDVEIPCQKVDGPKSYAVQTLEI